MQSKLTIEGVIMIKDCTTAKNRNRKIRQDNLRESLIAGGHIQHVVDISDKLSDLNIVLDQVDVTRLKSAADIKMKLIDKFLPGLKQIEVTDEDGNSVPLFNIQITHE